MAPKEYFDGIFKASREEHQNPSDFLTFMAKDVFTFPQLLLLGALLQLAIISLLPARYALLPTALLLLHTAATVTIQSLSPARNTFLRGTIRSKTTAQLPNPSYHPDPAAGKPLFGPRPASQGVVVLHLGVRFNHPLGPFSPGGKETAAHFNRCAEELSLRGEEFGCIGSTLWRADERSSHNTMLLVFYFRSVEGLHAFAHDKVHRDAWDWITAFAKKAGNRHIGIFHETFASLPGGYETIYVDMPPLLLGASSVGVKNEESDEREYVVPLVNADTSALRSQFGRMDRTASGTPVQR